MENKNVTFISKNTSNFLRGIAILMVISSHYFEFAINEVNSKAVANFIMRLGDWGVGIFFFLSGYALYLKYGSANTDRKYIIGRLANMYFPYLVITVTIGLITHSIDSLRSVIRLLIGADYWFIEEILLIYVVFYLVGKLPGKYRVFIMSIFIIAMSLWFYIRGYQDFWYTATWAFALGMIVSKYVRKIRFIHDDFSIDINEPVISFLGKRSIYIYLLHSYIYILVINSQAMENVNWYLKMCISTLITVAISYLLDLICKLIFRRKQ